MQYRKSLEIEQQLNRVLKLIRRGRFSTPALAELSVSVPTISRWVQALRERGHEIRAESGEGSWRYVLVRQPKASATKTD